VIELSAADRAALKQRARAYTAPHHQVMRAKIVLLAWDGLENTVIADGSTWRCNWCPSGASGSTRKAWTA